MRRQEAPKAKAADAAARPQPPTYAPPARPVPPPLSARRGPTGPPREPLGAQVPSAVATPVAGTGGSSSTTGAGGRGGLGGPGGPASARGVLPPRQDVRSTLSEATKQPAAARRRGGDEAPMSARASRASSERPAARASRAEEPPTSARALQSAVEDPPSSARVVRTTSEKLPARGASSTPLQRQPAVGRSQSSGPGPAGQRRGGSTRQSEAAAEAAAAALAKKGKSEDAAAPQGDDAGSEASNPKPKAAGPKPTPAAWFLPESGEDVGMPKEGEDYMLPLQLQLHGSLPQDVGTAYVVQYVDCADIPEALQQGASASGAPPAPAAGAKAGALPKLKKPEPASQQTSAKGKAASGRADKSKPAEPEVPWRTVQTVAVAASLEGSDDAAASPTVGVSSERCIRRDVKLSLSRLPARVQCRLAPKVTPDWLKWTQTVKKDGLALMGQEFPPILLAPAAPREVRLAAGDDGLASDKVTQLVTISWTGDSATNQLMALLGSTLQWQYRWRRLATRSAAGQWKKVEEGWTIGSMLTTALIGSKHSAHESGWLRCPWQLGDASSYQVVCSVRYVGPMCSQWSPWSVESDAATLGFGPPTPRKAASSSDEVFFARFRDDSMSEATLVCKAFESQRQQVGLEYRFELKSAATKGCPSVVGFVERTGSDISEVCCELRCLLPITEYIAFVRARHENSGQGWSPALEVAFCTPSSLVDRSSIAPPELEALPTAESPAADAYSNFLPTHRRLRLPMSLANLPPEDVRLEWLSASASAGDSSWMPLTWTPSRNEAEKQVVEVDVKGTAEDIYIRCVDVKRGVASSCQRVAVFFPAPAGLQAILIASDADLHVKVTAKIPRGYQSRLSRFQVKVEPRGNCELTTYLPCLALAGKETEVTVPIGKGVLAPHGVYSFSARLGDHAGWSEWCASSPVVQCHVVAPQLPMNTTLSATVSPESDTTAMLKWEHFRGHAGLRRIDYHVDVAPLGRPEEADEVFVGAESQPPGGPCQASVARLVPDTEYLFVVSAMYPLLANVTQEEEPCPVLTAKLRMPSIEHPDVLPIAAPALATADTLAAASLLGKINLSTFEDRRRLPILLDKRATIDTFQTSSGYVLQWREALSEGALQPWLDATAVELVATVEEGFELEAGKVLGSWDLSAEEEWQARRPGRVAEEENTP
eukprot:TRINITY_DN45188_c0_g1_i2.p1 TRINITY_DN45188_c0_g1~~TRINITY_DN45188_c0_g1_i2.p1  ORF type:complete len:1166 (+),score=240.24 TRINITY_DN45188_c0_g1_i2:106-3603(+)